MQHKTMSCLAFDDILLSRKRLRRELLACPNLKDVRIAVLGGTTTTEMVEFLEILLLRDGIRPTFYQSEYGRCYEDAVLEPELVAAFRPDIVYLHTCSFNLREYPGVACSENELDSFVSAELSRFRAIWTSLHNSVRCQIIQNNFELPSTAILGNLDTVSAGGATRFILELNRRFAQDASAIPYLTLQDQFGISARLGLNQWFDATRWFSYKISNSPEGSFAVASSCAALIRALLGRSRKVLVLDLDNTLWGGVIGDDGVDQLVLGRETPLAEAYTAFQEYCLSLRARGVLLAVCSKNDDEIARQGFAHTDSVLKLEHFSAFKANWEAKPENILAIAEELNLGVDSFVFVDDNPAERAIVEAQLPQVAVPDVGSDVTDYSSIIESYRYFEPVSLGEEDLARANLYAENAQRATLSQTFSNYGEYLDSLEMTAEIDAFCPTYLERIAQLTNKSNQFNLTTRRYTLAEIDAASRNSQQIGLYGKLSDRFGDNGLVSVVLGSIDDRRLYLDLWLMSCRVLKREMEVAMLDVMVARARARGLSELVGCYLPTAKNNMVADHYEKLGFSSLSRNEETGATTWSLDIARYEPRSRHIRVLEPVHG